jgi:hypothetical protein
MVPRKRRAMTAKIFISHALHDKDLVQGVKDALMKQGLNGSYVTDFPSQIDLTVGESFRDALRRWIMSADYFVLFWTEAAATSEWCNYEAGMAEALGKKVIVVMPEHCQAKLPSSLSGYPILRVENINRTDP